MSPDRNDSHLSAGSPEALSTADAVLLIEHPELFRTAFSTEAERSAAARRVDALVDEARRERPLVWQAYEARCQRRQRVHPSLGGVELARAILAAQRGGEGHRST